MSGHSKWSTIKRKKGAKDQKRGALFTKLIKAITSAVRSGGSPDPEANFKLRLAVDKAKSCSMPLSNIESAIKKASGEGQDGSQMEEVMYEGYAPGGVAVLVETLTDNRNRTAAEIRHIFSKNNGNLGESGCVSYLFSQKGIIFVPCSSEQKDDLMLQLMELAIEDISEDEDGLEITTKISEFENVKKYLTEHGIAFEDAEITMQPHNSIQIQDAKTASQILKLIDALEDQEDVQEVHANFDIPDDILNTLDQEH